MDIKKNDEENEVVDNKCVVQHYSREMNIENRRKRQWLERLL